MFFTFLLISGVAYASLEIETYLQSNGNFRNLQLIIGSESTSMDCSIDTVGGDIALGQDFYDKDFSNTIHEVELPDTILGDYKVQFSPDWYMNTIVGQGYFFDDRIKVGGHVFENMSFAISESGFTGCIFGIAPSDTESVFSIGGDEAYEKPFYNNTLNQLVDEKVINTPAYSIWTGKDTKGTLLFGAIDHGKFQGELTLVPLLQRYRNGIGSSLYYYKSVPGPNIMLHSIRIGANADGEGASDIPINHNVIISAGALYSWSNIDFVAGLGSALGFTNQDWDVTYDPSVSNIPNAYGTGFVWNYCKDLPDFDGRYLILNFSGVDIAIPIEDLIAKGPDLKIDSLKSGDQDICALSLRADVDDSDRPPALSNDEIIFGYPIADKMYIAFDYSDNYQAGIAQAVGDAGDSNIEEIVSKLPGTSAALYSSTSINTDFSQMLSDMSAQAVKRGAPATATNGEAKSQTIWPFSTHFVSATSETPRTTSQ